MTRQATPSSEPAVELDEAKLSIPVPRPGIVVRRTLVDRLLAPPRPPVVSVIAPAGYGKTTLLAQWAARDRRRFAWVQLDERDNDPALLLAYIVAALDRIEPVDEAVLRALATPAASIWPTLVPRLGAELTSRKRRFVLVLDDVQELRSRESLDALTAIVHHLPKGSQIALAGRSSLKLPVERLRLADALLELETTELALSPDEAQTLLEQAGIEMPDEDAKDLAGRTEGWAAGLYLAALALRDRSDWAGVPFGGDDRFVTDYLRNEYFARLSRKQLQFLTRTAVLNRMCGDLCDAVLERSDSARMLESIERSNLFLVALDRRRTWFRYHQLFRDALRAELVRREPGSAQGLYGPAADWCEANDLPEDALDYAAAGGDMERAARLLTDLAHPLSRAGRMATVEGWLHRLRLPVDRYPAAAVFQAWLHVYQGRAAEAERLVDTLRRSTYDGPMPDGSASVQPWVATLTAFVCPAGIERMREDAELAVAELAPLSPWRASAHLMLGNTYLLEGDIDHAEVLLAQAADLALADGAIFAAVTALAQRALFALDRDDRVAARRLVREASSGFDDARFEGYFPMAILLAARARIALADGDHENARSYIVRAHRLRPLLTYAMPWFAAQTLVELTRTHLALGDATGAGTVLTQARDVLRVRPCLGVLVAQVADLRHRLTSFERPGSVWASSLTAAELRLLPLLSTHLTFREIGSRLYVSRNTVKTQAISIYRKLDVSSRGDAVARAAELGLVDMPTRVPAGDFTLSG